MASYALILHWAVSSIIIGLMGIVQIFASKMPQLFQDAILYGKARGKRVQRTIIQKIEVPKRWFSHYYATGILVNSFYLYLVVTAYFYGQPIPEWFRLFLDEYIISKKESSSGAVPSTILIALMVVQDTRRFLECKFVSVYSNGTMNLFHYILGIFFYSLWGLAVLSDAPDLRTYRVTDLKSELLTVSNTVGIVLFLWASYHHHIAHDIFANLRKSKSGEVSTFQHKIPYGDWFQYVSCPHYFAEILIYLAFFIIAGTSSLTVISQIIFVFDNQLIAGYINHLWYLEEFKDYPCDRKAIVPFLL